MVTQRWEIRARPRFTHQSAVRRSGRAGSRDPRALSRSDVHSAGRMAAARRYAMGGRSAGSRPRLGGTRSTCTIGRSRRVALSSATCGDNAASSAGLCPTTQTHVPRQGQVHSCGRLQRSAQPLSSSVQDDVVRWLTARMVDTATSLPGSVKSLIVGVAAVDDDAATAPGIGHGLEPAVPRNNISDAANSPTAHGVAAPRRAGPRRQPADARSMTVGVEVTELLTP